MPVSLLHRFALLLAITSGAGPVQAESWPAVEWAREVVPASPAIAALEAYAFPGATPKSARACAPMPCWSSAMAGWFTSATPGRLEPLRRT